MRYCIFISVFFLLRFFALYAQNIECIGNTVILPLSGYKSGQIQWQFSNDGKIWKTLPGMTGEKLVHTLTETGYFRAQIYFNNCYFYSDTVFIEAYEKPTMANAGEDQFKTGEDTVVFLSANTPVSGIGTWSVISGTGGSFSDVHDPYAVFTGQQCIDYTLRWTISSPCMSFYDDLQVMFRNDPDSAEAGADHYIESGDTIVQLMAKTPEKGVGKWSVISGEGGIFSDAMNPHSLFKGRQCMSYVLRWTVSTKCSTSFDDVSITFITIPTVANAGPDQYKIMGDTLIITLAANQPVVGEGKWTIISGEGGSFSNATDPFSTFRGKQCETYVLRWTISNSCTSTFDDMIAAFTTEPTVANAGPDQEKLNADTLILLLGANTPVIGTGKWFLVSGNEGFFANENDPVTAFRGIQCENYILRWTISTPCKTSADDVNISFSTKPTPSDAGADISKGNGDTIVILDANIPVTGTGRWSVISGNGGIFTNISNPKTTFAGRQCSDYLLQWTISSPCRDTSDVIKVSFYTEPTIAEAGQDILKNDGDTLVFLSANLPASGAGKWSVVSGEDGSFSNEKSPNSFFRGRQNKAYILRWTISTACRQSSDEVNVIFQSE